MYCSQCGALVTYGSLFCSGCGTPVSSLADGESTVRRPGIVTVLAVLQFIGGVLGILWAVGMTLAASDPGMDEELFLALALGAGAIGVAQLFCGNGLMKLRPYGRTLLLVFSWIGLLAVPLGTIVAIAVLIYMYKPGTKLLFSGKSASEFSPEELREVAAVTRGSSAAMVLIVVLVILLAVAALGVVAAIAVPGLMRAREAANETAAIAALRAISGAEAVYSVECAGGGFAVTLEDLALPRAGKAAGFITPDLGRNGVVQSGYVLTLGRNASAGTTDVGTAAGTCNASASTPASSYFASAAPAAPGTTGRRYFATDDRGTVYMSDSPIANPIVESATVVPVR